MEPVDTILISNCADDEKRHASRRCFGATTAYHKIWTVHLDEHTPQTSEKNKSREQEIIDSYVLGFCLRRLAIAAAIINTAVVTYDLVNESTPDRTLQECDLLGFRLFAKDLFPAPASLMVILSTLLLLASLTAIVAVVRRHSPLIVFWMLVIAGPEIATHLLLSVQWILNCHPEGLAIIKRAGYILIKLDIFLVIAQYRAQFTELADLKRYDFV